MDGWEWQPSKIDELDRSMFDSKWVATLDYPSYGVVVYPVDEFSRFGESRDHYISVFAGLEATEGGAAVDGVGSIKSDTDETFLGCEPIEE